MYGQQDYERFWRQYIRNRDDVQVAEWAIEDFTKPGIPTVERQTWMPDATDAYQDSPTEIVFALAYDAARRRRQGARRAGLPRYTVTDDVLHIFACAWFD